MQDNIPLFVKVPWDGWSKGDHFNWVERNIPREKVLVLFNHGYVYHNEELEEKIEIGDRLNGFSQHELKLLVQNINYDLKKKCSTDIQFKKSRCTQSAIKNTQILRIRRWMNNFPEYNDIFIEHRDRLLEKRKNREVAPQEE